MERLKQRVTVAFFVSVNGGKLINQPSSGEGKTLGVFIKRMLQQNLLWSLIFQTTIPGCKMNLYGRDLGLLIRQMIQLSRNVILFMHNPTVRPESFVGKYKKTKTVFPKNTTSRLQTLDAGII